MSNTTPHSFELSPLLQEAMSLREPAVEAVTTTCGRAILKGLALVNMNIPTGYLPAPLLARPIETDHDDTALNGNRFIVGRGSIDPKLWRTVISVYNLRSHTIERQIVYNMQRDEINVQLQAMRQEGGAPVLDHFIDPNSSSAESLVFSLKQALNSLARN